VGPVSFIAAFAAATFAGVALALAVVAVVNGEGYAIRLWPNISEVSRLNRQIFLFYFATPCTVLTYK
jgi:hypothetical protein